MSKSAIYAVNNAAQTVTPGSVINLGNAVRRFGCSCRVDGTNVVVRGAGYYAIDLNVNFTGAAGVTTISILKDGVKIPGAESVMTTAAGARYHATIPAIVRQTCECDAVISVLVEGVAAAVTDVAIEVVKL